MNIKLKEINFSRQPVLLFFEISSSDLTYYFQTIKIELMDSITADDIKRKIEEQFYEEKGSEELRIEFDDNFTNNLNKIIMSLQQLNNPVTIDKRECQWAIAKLEQQTDELKNTEFMKLRELKSLYEKMVKLSDEVTDNAKYLSQSKTLIANMKELLTKEVDFSDLIDIKTVLNLMVEIINNSDMIVKQYIDIQDDWELEDCLKISKQFKQLKEYLNKIDIADELIGF